MRYDVPLGHPHFGKIFPCPACNKPDYLRSCGVPPSQQDKSLASFQLLPGLGKAYEVASVLGDGTAPFFMALLYGRPGTGKTHLLYAATLAACARNIPARYMTMPELMSELKKRMNQTEEENTISNYEGYWEALKTRLPFLALDAVGDYVPSSNDWQWTVFDELVDARYARHLVTLCASNISIAQLPDRSLSRFMDQHASRLVLLDALDFRLR